MKYTHCVVGILFIGIPLISSFADQISISRVDEFPQIPDTLDIPDYVELATAFDAEVFDPVSVRGMSFGVLNPLLWWDNSNVNYVGVDFGLPSYVGSFFVTAPGAGHEALACLGSVVGGGLVGIDKSNQSGPGFYQADFVSMCAQYFNTANAEYVLLNYSSTTSGQSWWYEIYPGILAMQAIHLFPQNNALYTPMYTSANRWYDMLYAMKGGDPYPLSFDFTSYDHITAQMVHSGAGSIQPEAAAGLSYLLYMAHQKWGETHHRTGAEWCLEYLSNRSTSPAYEMLTPFGALTAARMNAEHGTSYSVEDLVNWSFDLSSYRGGEGWGSLVGTFGSEQINGLMGQSYDEGVGGGYAFSFNTFGAAAPLVPLVRYDNRFARSIGKWMLHAANNARLFFSPWISDGYESDAADSAVLHDAIPYEGLKEVGPTGQSPYAGGDAAGSWAESNLSIYSGSQMGVFGAIIRDTNNPYILQLNCLATDFFGTDAYPTYLYYNPHGSASWVNIDVGSSPSMLYDAVSNSWKVQSPQAGYLNFLVPADGASVLVVVPGNAVIEQSGDQLIADGKVIDFNIYD